MHRTDTDGALVDAALAGDRRAFGVLVDRHVGRAIALVTGLLGSRAEVEDIVQEAILQAYLGLRDLRDPSSFAAWFCAIALNLTKMRLRKSRERSVPLDDLERAASEDGLEAHERLQAIRAALAGLSDSEREAVLLHYVGGLSVPEIAGRAGERDGTVRVRLHRARRRLQAVLAAFTPATRKERQMIEVDVRDVVVRVARNGDGGEPKLALPTRIVLLAEKQGGRLLPIWVGAPEGDALMLKLVKASPTPRPMTFDLLVRVLEATGATIERVVVSSLRENVFYAAVYIASAGATVQEVDARPSDGINLAVRVGAPIYVDDEVFDQAGIEADDADSLDQELAKACARSGQEAPPPGEWRSLTPDLVWPEQPRR